ncbi:MAG TPA: tetratricopeptide repeat protein, partial [bacterium]|nr:tetratricopeptide repeat protein [bacterium]
MAQAVPGVHPLAAEARLELAQRLELDNLIRRMRLHVGQGGIFLAAVTDDATRALVQARIRAGLADLEWLDLSLTGDDPLSEAARIREARGTSEAIFAADLRGLDEKRERRALVNLNTRREYVPDKHVLLLIWCRPGQLRHVSDTAKDFWSFRTDVARFGVMPDHAGKGTSLPAVMEKELAEARAALVRARNTRNPAPSLLPSLQFRLAELLSDAGRPDEALEHYLPAVDAYRRLDDKRNLGAVLGNIGLIYSARGEPDQALKYLEEALATYREIGYQQGVASDLGNIGLIYSDKGEPDKALRYLEEALAIHREIGYQRGVASALGNIGNIYIVKGEPDKALK